MELWNFEIEKELSLPKKVNTPYTWVGHFPLLNLLIKAITPKVLVELGTHSGNSFNYACQVVKENNLTTKCYAIDCWEGDEHAGFYDNSVYEELLNYQKDNYSEFATLIRKYFADAVQDFSDRSIDLLHIDGLHTYEAVKEDFYTWLPKLSDKAIVLFHDTNVYERGFGVHEFWDEITKEYTGFEFKLSHGLGVLVVGGNVEQKVIDFIESAKSSPALVNSMAMMLSRNILNDEQYKYLLDLESKQININCITHLITEVFYCDNGSDFSEQNKLFKINNNFPVVEHEFKFDKSIDVRKLRLDLSHLAIKISDTSRIILKLSNGQIIDKKILELEHNGVNQDGFILFPNDSQIVVPVQENKIVSIDVKFEVKSYGEVLLSEFQTLIDEVNKLNSQCNKSNTDIEELNMEIKKLNVEINSLGVELEEKNVILNSRKNIFIACIRRWFNL